MVAICVAPFFVLSPLSKFCDIIERFGETMQNIKISKSLTAKAYDQNDVIFDNKNVTDDLLCVLKKEPATQENFQLADTQEYIANLNSAIYIDKLKVKIFVLYSNLTPVSFAIFEQKNSPIFCLKFVWTSIDYAKLGFASILLRASVANLIECGAKKIVAEVLQSDKIADNLLESFSKIEEINTQKTEKFDKKEKVQKNVFEFDVSKLDDKQLLQDIVKMAI